ncbi:threonine ammonia-lyase [Pseudoxanthomonas dokdonensis]|uniref:Serine dehydratase n=1 Tax=Pseudoxanthomonas dokdonensis TaxID=344882 RepID=A0A0R0CTR4_9GAMM|nr:threonine/serine dehydratase [Pseudoxanthomonas dokdonensis]KRG68264.1 serine dehydratase [Pseudoxanthomonas dokdonensis]
MNEPFCSFADVLAAAARIAPHVNATPVLQSRSLEQLLGASVWFKAEPMQRTGSFKFRGACNAVWALPATQAGKGVITHSSGNHGAALALAARTRDIPCHVVVPHGAVPAKVASIRRYGATVHVCAPTAADREQTCARIAGETGATMIHPYANAQVIAGQGTAALELINAAGPLDVVMAPVGGGGLMSGTAIATAAMAPACARWGAEPEGAADTARSLAAGRREVDFVPDTVCDGLRGPVGAPNFELLRAHGVQVTTVSDDETVAAMRQLWECLKVVVEPSSATVLAALLKQRDAIAGKRVGVILSGGNVDLDAMPWSSR